MGLCSSVKEGNRQLQLCQQRSGQLEQGNDPSPPSVQNCGKTTALQDKKDSDKYTQLSSLEGLQINHWAGSPDIQDRLRTGFVHPYRREG